MASKYDNKDCTGWDLSNRTDMDGLNIEGLCLSNETPDAKVLPPKLKGTTFIACNLDNVFIPDGNTIDESCSIRRFQVQNDGEDWEIQPTTNIPITPINPQSFLNLNLSIDPEDIPAAPSGESIITKTLVAKGELVQNIADIRKEMTNGIS